MSLAFEDLLVAYSAHPSEELANRDEHVTLARRWHGGDGGDGSWHGGHGSWHGGHAKWHGGHTKWYDEHGRW